MGAIAFDGLKLSKYSPYYEQEVGFEIRDGLLGLKTAYTFAWGPEEHVLRVADGTVFCAFGKLGEKSFSLALCPLAAVV